MQRKFMQLSLLTAALTLTACSSDSLQVTSQDVVAAANRDDNSIQFGTYLGRQGVTRTGYSSGPIANDANPTAGVHALSEAEFGVFAYQTTTNYDNTTPSTAPSNIAPNFMFNQEVTWNSPNWTYTPVKYWPNGTDAANGGANPSNSATSDNNDRLSFFAVAPFINIPTGDYNESWYGALPSDISYAGYVKTNNKTYGINSMTTNTFTGNVWVKYLMPIAQESSAVDLLWGTNGKTSYSETDDTNPTLLSIGTDYNMNLTKQTVEEKVKFLFKHALAKIGGNTETDTETADESAPKSCGYQIKLDVDGNYGDNQNSFFGSTFTNEKTLVTVEKVEIMDGKSANEKFWGIGVTTSNLANSGWFNIEQGKWDATTIKIGATYSITADNTDTNVDNDTYSLNPNIKEGTVNVKSTLTESDDWSATSGSNAYTGGATGVTVEALPLFAKENVPGLMVIPSTEDQTIYVRIKYHVRTLDENLSTKHTHVTQTITNAVNLSSLEPNKYYKIIMHLGLTSVKFEAKVSDWQTKSGSNIGEDGHETGGSGDNESSVWLPSNVISTATALTVESGSNAVTNVVASAIDSYTITVTGLHEGNTVTVTYLDGTNIDSTTPAKDAATSLGTGETTKEVTVKLKANSLSSIKDNLLTIIEKNGGGDVVSTTRVTIKQAANS